MGNLSNTNIKFRLYGNNPVYSKEPDVIAFFSPMKNHKSFADISFTNEWKPERQDYYPLTGKNDYRTISIPLFRILKPCVLLMKRD